MKVETKAYGSLDVDERQTVVFPSGILGFEELKNYVLLDAEQQPYYWLQSQDNKQIAFILIDPFLFRPDYELDANENELSEIGIKRQENALVFAIVTIPPDGSSVTANLQGPIIINKETRKAKQLILNDTRWQTKHDIIKELTLYSDAKKAPC